MQLENISYGIEPLESSATYEHMIYQIKDNKSDFPPIVKNHSTTQFPDQPFKILVKSEVSDHFYEIFICATFDMLIYIEICYIWKTDLN